MLPSITALLALSGLVLQTRFLARYSGPNKHTPIAAAESRRKAAPTYHRVGSIQTALAVTPAYDRLIQYAEELAGQ